MKDIPSQELRDVYEGGMMAGGDGSGGVNKRRFDAKLNRRIQDLKRQRRLEEIKALPIEDGTMMRLRSLRR